MKHKETSKTSTRFQYSPADPRYYRAGCVVLKPKAIRDTARYSGRRGFLDEAIATAQKLKEPERTIKLRQLHSRVLSDLQLDLVDYRRLALTLHRYRRKSKASRAQDHAMEIYAKISVRYGEVADGFAHLEAFNAIPNLQYDLFAP